MSEHDRQEILFSRKTYMYHGYTRRVLATTPSGLRLKDKTSQMLLEIELFSLCLPAGQRETVTRLHGAAEFACLLVTSSSTYLRHFFTS